MGVMRIGPLITSSISARPASDSRQRASIVRAFERTLSGRSYTLPLRWWNRIVATSSKLSIDCETAQVLSVARRP